MLVLGQAMIYYDYNRDQFNEYYRHQIEVLSTAHRDSHSVNLNNSEWRKNGKIKTIFHFFRVSLSVTLLIFHTVPPYTIDLNVHFMVTSSLMPKNQQAACLRCNWNRCQCIRSLQLCHTFMSVTVFIIIIVMCKLRSTTKQVIKSAKNGLFSLDRGEPTRDQMSNEQIDTELNCTICSFVYFFLTI